jgi:hypothetical protein
MKWQVSIIFFITLLAGCGGGGEDGGGSTPTANGSISGTAIKGPVTKATVMAFSIRADGTKGVRLDTAQTDGQGNFSVSVSDHSGPVLMEMTEGHYRDEATGNDMNMFQGDRMTCAIPFMSSNSVMSGIHITPLTSMAQRIAQNMAGGMNETTVTEANSAVGQYFDVNDILHTPPMDPLVDGSGAGANQYMRNYGMIIAAMSQYANMVGMPHSSGMVTSLMNDASDGIMDGMMGGTAIMMGGGMMGGMMMPHDAGTQGLANVMMDFIQSPMNRSNVTLQEMDALINKLNSSNGVIIQL